MIYSHNTFESLKTCFKMVNYEDRVRCETLKSQGLPAVEIARILGISG